MSSPFLDAFLEASPRELTAPTLATELREKIRDWFAARDNTMQSSELILTALADLAAEQVAANPTQSAQIKVFNGFIDDIVSHHKAEIRRRLGGVPCTIVKQ